MRHRTSEISARGAGTCKRYPFRSEIIELSTVCIVIHTAKLINADEKNKSRETLVIWYEVYGMKNILYR